MYIGEIHYFTIIVASVLASAFSFIWYSPFFFGVRELKTSWVSFLVRFIAFLFFTVTVSVLLNSLFIPSVTGILYFIAWVSVGMFLASTSIFLARINPEGFWRQLMIELGHAIFVTAIVSTILFLI